LAWGEAKRWLYRGNRPGAFVRLVNRGFAALHASRYAPEHWVTLQVSGRRSGRPISFPVVVADHGGQRYLVSMLGPDAAWVRNVAAAGGRAALIHGRSEPVRLEELAVEKRAPVLKAYLQVAPGARPHMPVSKDAPIEAFEAVADRFPVFRVLPASSAG
jgi:deazaflavin-dependent oxidoreductase (nitroreductase family)